MTATTCTPSHGDRNSTRLNSSHLGISYAVFCLKKKNNRAAARQLPDRAPRPLPSADEPHGQVRLRPVQLLHRILPAFFFNNRATPEIYPLPPHVALPI